MIEFEVGRLAMINDKLVFNNKLKFFLTKLPLYILINYLLGALAMVLFISVFFLFDLI